MVCVRVCVCVSDLQATSDLVWRELDETMSAILEIVKNPMMNR